MAIPARTARPGTFFVTTGICNRRLLFQIVLLTPEAITREHAIGLIKGGFFRRLGSKMPVWQRGFTDHRAQHRVMAF